MKPVRKVLSFLIPFLFFLANLIPAFAATVQYTYDTLDRLTQAQATDGTLLITYTYDDVGNRLSMSAQGIGVDTPDVDDAGEYTLDNASLDLTTTTYGEEYGNLMYEYAIGTACGETDVQGWTAFTVGPDGTAVLSGLNLPYEQQYFISVRVLDFSGDVLSDLGCNNGIIVLDPAGDYDGDGADSQSEVDAGSNPLNPDSYPAITTVLLQTGFNLAAIPEDITDRTDLEVWLPTFGTSSEIEKVMVYDDQAGNFITLIPDDTSNPSFTLQGGEGLIVYAKQDKEITFTTVLCSTVDLRAGFNLVGFACPPDGYTAFQLLNAVGSANISSIQRYSTEKGSFETAGFDENGQIAGVDFPIVAGEGYFVFMKQEVGGF